MSHGRKYCYCIVVLLVCLTNNGIAQQISSAADTEYENANVPSAHAQVDGANFQGGLSDLVVDLLSRIAVRLFSGNSAQLLSDNEAKVLSENRAKLCSDVHVNLFSGNQIEIEITDNENNGSNNNASRGEKPKRAMHDTKITSSSILTTSIAAPSSGNSFLAAIPEADTQADLAQIQGLWERTERVGLTSTRRVTKAIDGSQETITYFGPQGDIDTAHTANIEVGRSGSIRIFGFDAVTIAAGPRKGQSTNRQGQYIYKVVDDKIIEIWGVLGDTDDPVRVLRWTRSPRHAD